MDKKKIQTILGIVLIIAGLGVFYRIPQVMPKVADIKAFAGSFVHPMRLPCLFIIMYFLSLAA